MFTRTTGSMIVLFWASAMAWLVVHDLWPAWAAQDVPTVQASDWLKTEGRESQFGIFDKVGRVGTIWTVYRVDDVSILREDLIAVERFTVPVAPLYISVDSVFTAQGLLDEFTLNLASRDALLELHGERFHSDFSFTLDFGPAIRSFKIPLNQAGMITGAFNPFTQLADLQVGQSWRMQVFNPVAALTGVGDTFIPMLVRVTGSETVATMDGVKTCMVVESTGAKAWVDFYGVVQRQEITLPVGGTMTIVREPFDYHERMQARTQYARTKGRH